MSNTHANYMIIMLAMTITSGKSSTNYIVSATHINKTIHNYWVACMRTLIEYFDDTFTRSL